jgi:hypothetical protein
MPNRMLTILGEAALATPGIEANATSNTFLRRMLIMDLNIA